MVHYSTNYVFDGQIDRPYTVDDVPAPLSAYGKSKLLGEREVAKVDHLSWLIIRTSGVFGRYAHCFPSAVLNRANAQEALSVINDQLTQITYVDDLAEVTLKLVDLAKLGIWHVINEGSTTWLEVARAALEEFGVIGNLEPISSEDWSRHRIGTAPRPRNGVLDTQPLKEVGLDLRPWRQALKHYRTQIIGLAD